MKNNKSKSYPVMPEIGHREGIKCYGQFECEYCGINRSVRDHLDLLLGKILTTIDASIIESEQRKAVKDIIKGYAYSQFDYLQDEVMQIVHNCTEHKPDTPSRGAIDGMPRR